MWNTEWIDLCEKTGNKEKELFQGKELNWKPSQQRYKSKQKKKKERKVNK